MDFQRLDFSVCPEYVRNAREGTTCPDLDPTCGFCRRCDDLCRVYAHYLVKEGTSVDLMEFWAHQRSRSKLLLHATSRP